MVHNAPGAGPQKGCCGTATRLSFPKGVFIKREGVNMEFKIKGKLGIGIDDLECFP